MLLPVIALALTAFIDEDAPEPPAETSRWGAAAGTTFGLGVAHGVNLTLGPRFGLLEPTHDTTYLTPAVALLVEGDIGTERTTGTFGVQARIELLVAPPGGLLAPWVELWLSGGGGVAYLGSTVPLWMAHVGVGLGGNAFADGGAWGPNSSWADWMDTLAWPLTLFGTVVGLPIAMLNVELRMTWYGGKAFPSVLLGFGM